MNEKNNVCFLLSASVNYKTTEPVFIFCSLAFLLLKSSFIKHILLCFLRSAAGPLLSSGRNRYRLQSCLLGLYVLNDGCMTPHPDNNQRQ